MKQKITKFKEILRHNILLSISFIVVIAIVFVMLWKWTLVASDKKMNSISVMRERDIEKLDKNERDYKTDKLSEAYLGSVELNDELAIEYMKDGAFLMDSKGNTLCGPYQFIYTEDIGKYDTIFRFIGKEKGLIGFSTIEGRELVEEKFTEATPMEDGSACVREGNDLYYIDENGIRFTSGDYIEAYPFQESQGSYARVKKKYGSWCIINKKEEIVFDNLDSVCELPYITTIATGVRDGKVILFDFYDCTLENPEPRIIQEYSEYVSVSPPYSDFAVVTTAEGKKGVICTWNGEKIVDAEYVDIQWKAYFSDDMSQRYLFKCKKGDGTIEVKHWSIH